ncbi:MAG: undecaprenyl-diphosphatase UppP [Acidimicrobiia bacterium]|nr:undecaprenyl-diphosphatase UppP [Acidimicrobiia bacterium]
MPILHAIILGIIQGLTEFLPISSSGHLAIIPQILGWNDLSATAEKTFDIALHAGTLVGAIVYLRKDIIEIIKGCLETLKTKKLNQQSRLGVFILLTAIPGALLGALFEDKIAQHLSKPALIASMLIIFAIILYLADRLKGNRNTDEFNFKDVLVVGVSQAFALQPGVSRSGITMTALRLKNFTREASARLSFLMLIPIVAGAALYSGAKGISQGTITSDMYWPMISGAVTSAIVGYFAVFYLLKLVRNKPFTSFVIYRIIAGIGIFVWLVIK